MRIVSGEGDFCQEFVLSGGNKPILKSNDAQRGRIAVAAARRRKAGVILKEAA